MKGFKILILSVFILTLSLTFTSCKKDNKLTNVKLNEVTHSIFYAPQYVAIEKGFFGDEGLLIELANGQGSDKSMTALISNSADIALLGTEAGIYVYNEGKENYAVCFAQLTQRAGNFLISRTNEINFNWNNVRGKKILGGRIGGMPYYDVTFETIEKLCEWTRVRENDNKNKSIDAYTDINLYL